jgi:hypothetical protein
VLGPQRLSWRVGQGKLTDVDWRSNSGSFAILTANRQLRYYCTFSLSGDPNLKGRQHGGLLFAFRSVQDCTSSGSLADIRREFAGSQSG